MESELILHGDLHSHISDDETSESTEDETAAKQTEPKDNDYPETGDCGCNFG